MVNEVNGIVSLETPNELKIEMALKMILGFGNIKTIHSKYNLCR